jgi:hypothetical protein
MPHDLEPDARLSRFLNRRSYINLEKGVPNTSVFSEKHPKGFSVFNGTNLNEPEIWLLAIKYVATPNRPILARCDVAVRYYEAADLRIEISQPPERHYDIFGMPVSAELQNAEKLSKRQQLLAKASLVWHPDYWKTRA